MTKSVQITRVQWQQKTAALLQRYIRLVAEHGVTVGPNLHLCEDPATPYHYCDVNTGQISLNLPGTESLADVISLISLGKSLGLDSLEEIIDLHEALLHFLLGHELGHYLRHRYGTMTQDRWVEEEAATVMGLSLACTCSEVIDRLPWLMQIAERIRPRLPIYQSALLIGLEATYPALRRRVAGGQDPEKVLCDLGLAAEAEAFSQERDALKRAFHERYITDPETYARQQTAWQVHWFLRPDRPDLKEAITTYLLAGDGPLRSSARWAVE